MAAVGGHGAARAAWSAVLLILGLSGVPGRLTAQDTVNVIDPNAPPAESPYRGGPPEEAVREAVARYNDSAATRLYGSFTVGSGTWIRGDVGMFRGTLRVMGRISGRVTVINGTLLIGPGAEVDGEVLLIGGRLLTQPGGRQTGGFRTYADVAPVYRTSAGLLEVRAAPPTLGDIATAQKTFTAGRLQATLSLGTGRTYNRVEGLPIIIGPTFSMPTPNDGEARLDLRGIIRTESDPTDQRDELGWLARFEWTKKTHMRYGIGGTWEQQVHPIEDQPLSLAEIGWSTFLFGRDYRDYYQDQSAGGYAWASPLRALRFDASVRYEHQTSVPASNPITVFRDPDPWRSNPLIDDGHYTTILLKAEYDSRNNVATPTSGWLARAWYQRSQSGDVAPAALPIEVREPLPTSDTYRFNRLGFDLRVYQRINTVTRANLRLVGAGWIGGDPLPIQRRVSLGGADLMPGYPFRDQNCAPAGYADPSKAALCDRMIAAQGELRFRLRFGLRERLGAQDWLVLERLFGADQMDIVLFGDMGKAWLTGDGPGRVPNNRLPVLREWAYDAGLGIDFDGLAVYAATPLVGKWSPRITLRLQRRF
jgi:hypothetical protein